MYALKPYIQNVNKKAAQRIGSLYRASRYLPPESILYLYKATIRPLMEYCCHLWVGAPKTRLQLLDPVEKRAKKPDWPAARWRASSIVCQTRRDFPQSLLQILLWQMQLCA